MAARTALITGILGQDGSLLSELLLSRGYRVVGVARPGSAVPLVSAPDEKIVVVDDLTHGPSVRALLDRWQPDEIYHLAAFHHAAQQGSVSAGAAGKQVMLATNFLSTQALAFAMIDTQSPAHLVYAGSSQMYTAHQTTEVIDESCARVPSTFYGHTKSWSADLLACLRADSGLRASVAILFNHESPRRGPQFVSRKITQAAAQAACGLKPSLGLYNLASRVDWSSAHDVVQALNLMAECETAQDFVVASGSLHTVRDMLAAAFGHVGLDWREFTNARDDHETPALVGRPDRLEALPGWRRSMSFADMVVDMVENDLRILRQ